jgi:hypothetical protein
MDPLARCGLAASIRVQANYRFTTFRERGPGREKLSVTMGVRDSPRGTRETSPPAPRTQNRRSRPDTRRAAIGTPDRSWTGAFAPRENPDDSERTMPTFEPGNLRSVAAVDPAFPAPERRRPQPRRHP